MNVVSCYKAAQIAQVTKQNISLKKKVNADNKSKYKYFCYDKETGEFGVDIDHLEWKKYIKSRQSSNKIVKNSPNSTDSQATVNEEEETVIKKHFAQSVVNAVKKKYNASPRDLNELVVIIREEYDKIIR